MTAQTNVPGNTTTLAISRQGVMRQNGDLSLWLWDSNLLHALPFEPGIGHALPILDTTNAGFPRESC